MKRVLTRAVLRTIQRHSDGTTVSRIRNVARAVVRASLNASYQFETNGEVRAARILVSGVRNAIVFDVGANVGDWSIHVLPHLGENSIIHAFEPSHEIFEKLSAKTRHCEAIHCHNIGLSDKEGPLELLFSSKNPQKSSVEASHAAKLNTKVTDYRRESLPFVRGADFARQHGISRIRFLKIDTEGHDLRVLEGFREMITAGAIDAIQFEYNAYCIHTKLLLHDFYEMLSHPGAEAHYVIGRIFPRSVHFKAFETQDENFIDGNFLAVRADLAEVIGALHTRSP